LSESSAATRPLTGGTDRSQGRNVTTEVLIRCSGQQCKLCTRWRLVILNQVLRPVSFKELRIVDTQILFCIFDKFHRF